MALGFRKWDIAAVASVAVLAALVFVLFLPKTDRAAVAEIYQDGELIKTVSLSGDQEFSVTGQYSATVSVRDGKIAVTRSDCPGGDCVRCGWISGAGRSIVCLPNGLEIRVIAGSSDVDFVVG